MDAKDKFVLAIDLGTSGAKVALVSIHGEVAGWEAEPVPLHLLPNGGAEQDPNDWWRAIVKGTRRLLGKGQVAIDDVVAVCAATQGAAAVPVDRNGDCVANAMIWLDSRGAELAQRLVAGPISIEGYDLFKLLRWVRLTGGVPSLSGKDLVGHVLYLKHESPEIYHKTYKFLDVVAYIDLRLTGKFIATSDTIGMSWVTDNRDPEHIRYDAGLIRATGIDPEKLPEIKRCIDVLGPITPEAAKELGLRPEVQVVAGAFDLPAAAVGSGAVEDYVAHLSISTSSFMTVHLPMKKTDLFNKIASMPCVIPDRYLVLAEQEAAGVNLTFLRDNLLYHDDPLQRGEKPEDYFEALNRVAEQVPPGSRGLIYTPWIYGERAPVDDPYVRASIFNLSLQNTREDLARAIMEGVAFNSRWMLEPVEKFCGRKLDPIIMVGGGANSNLWCQIHADVLDRTIKQGKNPIQAAAQGAAFIAAVGLGYIHFSDIPKLIQFQGEYRPNPDNRELYDELFVEFKNIYKQNRAIYKRLNRAKK
jgi:xylulokinase